LRKWSLYFPNFLTGNHIVGYLSHRFSPRFLFGILLTAFLHLSPFSGSWDSGVPCPWPAEHWTLRPKFINWPRRIYWRRSLFRHRWIYASMASARTIVTPRMPFAATRTCWRAPSPPFCPTLSRAIARYVFERHLHPRSCRHFIQHPAFKSTHGFGYMGMGIWVSCLWAWLSGFWLMHGQLQHCARLQFMLRPLSLPISCAWPGQITNHFIYLVCSR